MATNITLIKAVMKTLAALDGNPVPVTSLASEVEIRMSRPLVLQDVEDALTFARDHGWAQSRKDMFERTVWVITEAGRSA